MTESTERLISELVENLEPVRPVPRLRSGFAIILSIWATILGVVLWIQDHEMGASSLLSNRVYLASFLGLLVASWGGTASALASGEPGRERFEIGGMGLALLGLTVAAVACLVGIEGLAPTAPPMPPGANGMCLQQGVFLSLLPGGVILSFMSRGWVTHPIRAALMGLAAAGALGAAIIHLSCDVLGAEHLLMGHLGVPLVLVLLGLYPLGVLLRRLRG